MGLFIKTSRKVLKARIENMAQQKDALLKEFDLMRSERNRYKNKCVLINDLLSRVTPTKLISIETNKLDQEIFICETILGDSFSIYLFDSSYRNGHPALGIVSSIYMDYKSHSRYVYIEDINVQNIDAGNGSIAMDCFIKTAKALGFGHIEGSISPVDKDHFDRLEHFYSKFGFEVTLNENRTSGRIEKQLR